MKKNITVLLADDYPLVRLGLRLIIESQPGLEVVGEVDNGRDAVAQAVQTGVDIVIMDISMPQLDGIEATRQIWLACPKTQIIILSMYTSARYIFYALKAGARGYLIKSSALNEVTEAIRSVAFGQRYLSQKISDEVRDELHEYELQQLEDPLEQLSRREREVLRLLADSKTSAEIAAQLHLSAKTVETYRHRLMQKLNLPDLPSLIKFAIRHGLISLD